MKEVKEETTHAKCSPSQVARILACPASKAMNELYPDVSSAAADEGTMLHGVVEERLTYALFSPKFKHTPFSAIKFKSLEDKDHETAIQDCYDYLVSLLDDVATWANTQTSGSLTARDWLNNGGITVELEAKTSINWCGIKEVDGHSDVVIKSPRRRDVIDWKFGIGVPVYAPHNAQGMCYMAGTFNGAPELLDTESLYIHIIQPRLDYYGCWGLSSNTLFTWLTDVLYPGILAADFSDAAFTPGKKQCQFCVGVLCKARGRQAVSDASHIFSEYVNIDAKNEVGGLEAESEKQNNALQLMGDADLMHLLNMADSLKAFVSKLKSHAINRCTSGVGFPGYKMVAGRRSRQWVDPKAAEKWLVKYGEDTDEFVFDDLYKSEFLSVPKVEKLTKALKKNADFKILYTNFSGPPIMVPESDPRESVLKDASNVFSKYKK